MLELALSKSDFGHWPPTEEELLAKLREAGFDMAKPITMDAKPTMACWRQGGCCDKAVEMSKELVPPFNYCPWCGFAIQLMLVGGSDEAQGPKAPDTAQ